MKIIIFSILVCLSASAFSQTNADAEQETARSISFDGFMKTRFETSTERDAMRFNVRHARVGVRGDINEFLSLRMMAEMVIGDRFTVHDMFATLRPTRNFSVIFGQQLIPFDNGYIISPADQMFANVAFLGTYFNLGGVRDIGIGAQYRFSIGDLPMEGQAGLFNGGRINQPQWTDKPSLAFRLIAGSMEGFRSTAKIYRYQGAMLDLDLLLWGVDFRYSVGNLIVETEIMNRHSYTFDNDLFGAYIQGLYTFPIPNSRIFPSLTPALRWDAMGYDGLNFDVQRITAGIQFGLMPGLPFHSLIRIDYEHHIFRNKNIPFPDFVAPGRDSLVADNKLTVEWIVRF